MMSDIKILLSEHMKEDELLMVPETLPHRPGDIERRIASIKTLSNGDTFIFDPKGQDEETNRTVLKKQRMRDICRKTFKCEICPIHDGENRRRRPKPDKYKNKDREKPSTKEAVDE